MFSWKQNGIFCFHWNDVPSELIILFMDTKQLVTYYQSIIWLWYIFDHFTCLRELIQCVMSSSSYVNRCNHKLSTWMVSCPHEQMWCAFSDAPFVNNWNHKSNTWMVSCPHGLMQYAELSPPKINLCSFRALDSAQLFPEELKKQLN